MSKKVLLHADLEFRPAGNSPDPLVQTWHLSLQATWGDQGSPWDTARDGTDLAGSDVLPMPDPYLMAMIEALCTSTIQKAYGRGYRDGLLERKEGEAEEEIARGLRARERNLLNYEK